MADRLEIYRGALQLLGNSAGLSSLTEVNAARTALDETWATAVDYLLAEGFWNFAMRAIAIDNDEDVGAGFGHLYSFSKPADWVRTAAVSDSSTFSTVYNGFKDKGQYWTADVSTLYVEYVSSSIDYGWNVGAWRQPFAKALEAYLAFQSGLPISSDRGNRNDMHGLFKERLKRAKALDAVDEAVQSRPPGRLVTSRFSNRLTRDR